MKKIKYKVIDNYCSIEAWGFDTQDEEGDTGELRKQLLKLNKDDKIEIIVHKGKTVKKVVK